MKKIIIFVSLLTFVIFGAGCMTTATPPAPEQLSLPAPIQGSGGEYLCPFTSDDTIATWVQSGMSAKLGASLGGAAGAYAGQKAMEQVPLVGGFLGQKVGSSIGREVSIKAAGGREAMREQSDLSFDNVDDLALYMYIKGASYEEYADVLSMVQEIYPELKQRYWTAIYEAGQSNG